MAVLLKNNATSTLVSSIDADDTILVVQTVDAANFPSPTGGDWFPVTVVDPAGNMEIMACTARTAGSLTVTRAQESTTAQNFAAGSRVDLRLTVGALTELPKDFEDQAKAEDGTGTDKPMNALRTAQAIAAQKGSSFEIGDTLTTARNPGADWLLASGSLQSTTSYASLYAAIGFRFSPITNPLVPSKITDPAVLPTGNGAGAAWSPDGRYLAITHLISPYVTIYDWDTGAPLKITNPAVLPGGFGRSAAWSPDGRYLAVGHGTTPFVTIYDWVTGAPVKLANPAALPAGDGNGAGWSPDGRYLVVTHATTPFVTIYDWSTGVPVKLANPATLPVASGFGATWSPGGRYLAVAHSSSLYVTIYDWVTGVPVKIANPATLPTGTGSGAAFSPDGGCLVVTHATTPFITIYDNTKAPPSGMFYLPDVPSNSALRTFIKAQ